jgi:hypothetical protein
VCRVPREGLAARPRAQRSQRIRFVITLATMSLVTPMNMSFFMVMSP